MSFFGIDFGTTNSTAVHYVQGAPGVQHYGDNAGRPYPSIVAIDRATGKCISGRDVWEHHDELIQKGQHFIVQSVKRLLGRSHEVWPTQVRAWTTEDVATEILNRLSERARELGAGRISRAAVTIPVNFPASARKSLRQAAKNAGIEISTFIKEPTAALIRHLPRVRHLHYVAVFDWGGGTLDISILEIKNDRVFERATTGMNSAGDDIDLDLAEAVHARVMDQRGESKAFEEMPPKDRDQLRTRCEIAKCALSARASTLVLMQLYGDRELEVEVDQKWFETIIRGRVDDAVELLARTISAVPLSYDELDRLIVIGGSSKLRLLHERLHSDPRFQAKFQPSEDAEWDVAHGAAIVDSLSGGYETAESIGIILSDGTFYTIVGPNEKPYQTPREAAVALVEDSRQANIILARADMGQDDGDPTNISRILELGVPSAGFDAEEIRVSYTITPDLVFYVHARSHVLGERSGVAREYGNLRFAYRIQESR
jgi:molecular chaperone DnaK